MQVTRKQNQIFITHQQLMQGKWFFFAKITKSKLVLELFSAVLSWNVGKCRKYGTNRRRAEVFVERTRSDYARLEDFRRAIALQSESSCRKRIDSCLKWSTLPDDDTHTHHNESSKHPSVRNQQQKQLHIRNYRRPNFLRIFISGAWIKKNTHIFQLKMAERITR